MQPKHSKLRRYLGITLAGFVAFSLVMEVYCRTADHFDVTPLNLPADTDMAVLLFHGAQDQLNPEMGAIAERVGELLEDRAHTVVLNYDWSFGASARLRAASNGLVTGAVLGRELATVPELSHLRIIAHSAGAYVPDALCRAYRAAGGTAHIEVTFLDAFGLRGFIDRGYGARNHGSCADFAMSLVNTDDAAPTTNSLLENAWNIDVTGLRHPAAFLNRTDPRTKETDSMLRLNEAMDDARRTVGDAEYQGNGHYFPPYYFLQTLDRNSVEPAARSHADFPRGGVISGTPL